MQAEARNILYDLIRGVSALMVLLSHLRAVLLVDYPEINNPGPVHKVAYLASGLGHESVMIFFVLSGFFIGGNILHRRESFSWKSYSIARLSRLYTVLIPALVLTWLLDSLTGRFAPEALSGSLTPVWNSGPTAERPWSLEPGTLAGNLFFLQSIVTPVFGTNSPLWSLAYEFWYYVLFPLAVIVIGLVGRGVAHRVLAFVCLVALCFFLPSKILMSGLIWLLGVVLALTPVPKFRYRSLVCLFLLGAFLSSLVAAKANWLSHTGSDFAVAGCFTLLAMFLKENASKAARFVSTPARWLSEISFSLYIIHFPILFLAGALRYNGKQFQPDLTGVSVFVLWLLLILLISVAFWWLFERNTPYVRRWMTSRLGGSSPRPEVPGAGGRL